MSRMLTPFLKPERFRNSLKIASWVLPLAFGGVALACEGSLGKSGSGPSVGGDPDGEVCTVSEVGEQPLRRLSSVQYENTLGALFGEELGPLVTSGSLFPETEVDQGFRGDAEANTVNTSESNAIEDNAERIAGLILEDPAPFVTALMPCDVTPTSTAAAFSDCIDSFLGDFGRRAYRRPLTEEEAAIVRRVFDTVSAEQGGLVGFAAMVQLIVQSPALLYRVERGEGRTGEGYVRLSSYEMASRLSYFLTDSMPDDELLSAAAADELRTREQIRAQAERLAETEAFSATLTRFIEDWLHLYELPDAPKDPAIFPQFTNELRDSLLLETRRLLDTVLENGDGSLRTLLSTQVLPVSAATAPLYGVDAPGSWTDMEIPSRRGLLSQASVMAVLAEADRTSPIHRGAVFVRDVLCESLPALPGDVDTATALEDTSNLPTARERLAPLLESSGCRGCHQAFNPVGLAFEPYDAIGALRTEENGTPIDASGTFDLGEGDVAFSGPEELLEAVAESDKVHECFSRQAFRAMKGRREFAVDECNIQGATATFQESGGDIRTALLSLVETEAFLYRTGDAP